MFTHEFELSVGEVLRVGNRLVTVVDIDGDEVSVRIEECSGEAVTTEDDRSWMLPR